jgi:hypothetical protein
MNRLTFVKICGVRGINGLKLGVWDCDCGTKSYVCSISHVLCENNKSCGCLKKEMAVTIRVRGQAKLKEHGADFIDHLQDAVEGSESLDLEDSKGAVLPADPGGSDVQRSDCQAVE